MNIQRIISKLTFISLCFSTFFAFGTIPKVNGLDFVKVTPKFDTDRIGKVKLNNDLLAHYSFDGNGQDKSGNNNHSSVNGPSSTSNRFGHEDNAFAFSKDFILTPDFSQILDKELTVTGWLYRNQSSSGIEQVFEALTNVWEIFLETQTTSGNTARQRMQNAFGRLSAYVTSRNKDPATGRRYLCVLTCLLAFLRVRA